MSDKSKKHNTMVSKAKFERTHWDWTCDDRDFERRKKEAALLVTLRSSITCQQSMLVVHAQARKLLRRPVRSFLWVDARKCMHCSVLRALELTVVWWPHHRKVCVCVLRLWLGHKRWMTSRRERLVYAIECYWVWDAVKASTNASIWSSFEQRNMWRSSTWCEAGSTVRTAFCLDNMTSPIRISLELNSNTRS